MQRLEQRADSHRLLPRASSPWAHPPELITNDRVIGGLTSAAAAAGKDFYATFCKGELLATTARTAELVKLTENSFRDVNIAFANELACLRSPRYQRA